jgi:flagellar protein FlbD
MICLTRLDGTRLVVNSALIEIVEAKPDTIVTLTNGKKLVVREEPEVIIEKVIQFKKSVSDPFSERVREEEG